MECSTDKVEACGTGKSGWINEDIEPCEQTVPIAHLDEDVDEEMLNVHVDVPKNEQPSSSDKTDSESSQESKSSVEVDVMKEELIKKATNDVSLDDLLGDSIKAEPAKAMPEPVSEPL